MDHVLYYKGRTIRKVMGGGGWGIFSLPEFFFLPNSCARIFFLATALCMNFFFWGGGNIFLMHNLLLNYIYTTENLCQTECLVILAKYTSLNKA